jgi:hypothetical protein
MQQQLAQQQQEALVPLQPNHQQAPILAPPVLGILPLGAPPVAPAFAAQQPAKQKQRVDPRLLEEAAARQQALAEGKIVPQKTVINPDADWLQGLPQAMREMRVPEPYQTPRTSPEGTPILSPARKETAGMPMHATGDQSLWDIHDLPVPTRTMDFYELPTDTPIVVQKTTPRRSSRTKKPTDIYQAGLNSMQASSNPRGYVDSSIRYRSYSRDRFPRDQSRQRSPSRQDRYQRQPSREPYPRQDRYSRQPSRDASSRQDRYQRQPSRDSSYRQDSVRPARSMVKRSQT